MSMLSAQGDSLGFNVELGLIERTVLDEYRDRACEYKQSLDKGIEDGRIILMTS